MLILLQSTNQCTTASCAQKIHGEIRVQSVPLANINRTNARTNAVHTSCPAADLRSTLFIRRTIESWGAKQTRHVCLGRTGQRQTMVHTLQCNKKHRKRESLPRFSVKLCRLTGQHHNPRLSYQYIHIHIYMRLSTVFFRCLGSYPMISRRRLLFFVFFRLMQRSKVEDCMQLRRDGTRQPFRVKQYATVRKRVAIGNTATRAPLSYMTLVDQYIYIYICDDTVQ